MSAPALKKKLFPAKILLFGEHIINKGSGGLAVPFRRYGGNLELSSNLIQDEVSNLALKKLAEYMATRSEITAHFDTNRMLTDVERGLVFRSDIPIGYGTGSSGALCAAVYYNYYKSRKARLLPFDYPELKQWLCALEDHFHGKSSGLDALVSYLDKAIYIDEQKKYHVKKEDIGAPDGLSFFLIDSGLPRSTERMVTHFLERAKDPVFESLLRQAMVPIQRQCIEALFRNDATRLWDSMKMLSQIQYDHMPEFIPEANQSFWRAGLKSGAFFLKICGAGGGGYLLGLTQTGTDVQGILPKAKIIPVL